MRKLLCKSFTGLLLFLAGCSPTGPTISAERPNIILVMCDDLGWGDVGFNGHPVIKTPHLDRLAKKGMVLNRFYAASAVCSPTRASVLTGRNPFRMGIYTANAGHLPDGEISLPELLQENGYATGHFGKWHLGTLTRTIKDSNRGVPRDSTHYALPTSHGYDTYFCSESKTPTWDPLIKPLVFDTAKGESLRYGWAAVEAGDERAITSYGTHYWVGEEQMELQNLDGDDARIIMDRVLPFVDQATKDGNAFFSTIWFHTPHLPLVTGKKYRDLYSAADYKQQLLYGSISAMDEQLGRLWDQLETLGVADNTMLWFCSDNGPEDRTPGSSGPFRERKRSLYEGGVRVPAFLVWPQEIAAGQQSDVAMATQDYLPTILDYLSLDYPDATRPIDGLNLRPILEQQQEKRGKAIGFQFAKKRSWVTDQYKLISTDRGESFELYDLLSDPRESQNIASAFPAIVAEMKQELNSWISSCEKSDKGLDY